MSRSSIAISCVVAWALLSARASAEVAEGEPDGEPEGEPDEILVSEETLPPEEAEPPAAGETGEASRRRFAVRVGAVPVLVMSDAAGVKDQRGGALVGFTYSMWPRTGGILYESAWT